MHNWEDKTMHAMRRKDRQITDLEAIRAILDGEDVLHLAMCDENTPYVVPMSYGYELSEDGKLILYLHCASEGRKLEMLRKNPNVCFEVSRKIKLVYNEKMGSCTAKYRSVIGSGKAILEESAEEKLRSLDALMKQAGHAEHPPYEEKLLAITRTLRIEADEYTAKSNLLPGEEGYPA